jgi:hypothetical protein
MPHPLFTGLIRAATARIGPAIELVETVDLTTE